MRILVCGAGGFIGHALVKRLKQAGHWVRGVDLHVPQFEESPADEFLLVDLREKRDALSAAVGCQEIYQLAADMGGIGYISGNHAAIASNNVLINCHMIKAALANHARILYSSSACVYNAACQTQADDRKLREEDAYPAAPEEGYGWEKLFSEKLYQYHHADCGLPVRIVRFHNVYGPGGVFEGGREKAPAAACRKIALAHDGEVVEVWGDGRQTRSFLYIDDCLEGLTRLMGSDYCAPLNLGSEESVTIDQLFQTIASIAGKSIRLAHNLAGPQGVRGRNSDNSRLREVLNWEPLTWLHHGLQPTYQWVAAELKKSPSQAA